MRDTNVGSTSQGKGFENLVGVRNQPNNLTGNEVGNIILGGGVGDTLKGLAGRNILVGFQGIDTLEGGNDQDILIGGSVDFVGDGLGINNIDAEIAALIAIHREWVGPGMFEQRQTNIHTGVGSPSLNARLRTTAPGQTVFDDGVADLIDGGQGPNWIIEPPLNSPPAGLGLVGEGSDRGIPSLIDFVLDISRPSAKNQDRASDGSLAPSQPVRAGQEEDRLSESLWETLPIPVTLKEGSHLPDLVDSPPRVDENWLEELAGELSHFQLRPDRARRP